MTQREYYNLVKEGNIREALITMGVERAKDVSQANQLMNLRKVSTPFCVRTFHFLDTVFHIDVITAITN